MPAKYEGTLSQTGHTVFFRAEGRDEAECKTESSSTALTVDQLWARVCEVNASSQENAAEHGDARDARFEAATPDGAAVVFSSARLARLFRSRRCPNGR
jgi:hypothetical protein